MAQTFHGTLEDMGSNGPTLKQYLYDNWQAIVTQWAGENPPDNPYFGQPWLDISEGWSKAVLKMWNGISWVEASKNSTVNNDVELARGSKNTLWERLEVALNEDGTLKSNLAENMTEWIDSGLTPTYVSATEFSVDGDQTDIFVENRKIKATLDVSTVYSSVVSSVYDSFNDITSITIASGTIDNTLQKMEYGLVKPGDNGSQPDNVRQLHNNVRQLQDYTIDGFSDYVVDIEPQGGVKRIPYNDPSIEYSGGWHEGVIKDAKQKRATNTPDNTAKITFIGTGINIITYLDTANRSWKFKVDNGLETKLNTPTTQDGVYGYEVSLEVINDLSYGEHTLEIYPSGEDFEEVRFLYGFDIIQTTDNSSKTEAGVSYIDSEKQEILSKSQTYTTPTTGRCDLLVVDKQGNTSVVKGIDGQSEKGFRVEEDRTISREYIDDIPEWIKDGIKVWNSGITGNLATGWVKNNDKQSSGNYNLKTELTNATFYIGFVGTGIDLFNVTWSNAGEFAVSIDGGSETIFDAYSCDTVWENRVNIASGLDFGYHEVKIRVTGTKNASSTGFQIYIDAFDIYLPATPDIPADIQSLAKVYPMPEPATMASVPARPTSAEEKGWIRYESDEGCRFVGSEWSEYTLSPGESNHNSMISSTVGDYFEFIFIGDAVRLLGRLPNDSYNVEISIDGTVVDNLTTVVTETESVLYENTNLTNGYHTLRAEILSAGGNVHIDAFEVHRPLYLTDIRNTTPVKENDTYNIEHNSRLTAPKASGKLGEVIDKLFRMDNVIHISNDNGEAYLYPDGRAEIMGLQSGSTSAVETYIFPVVLGTLDLVELTIRAGTTYPGYIVWATNTDTAYIAYRKTYEQNGSFRGAITESVFIHVLGRWY